MVAIAEAQASDSTIPDLLKNPRLQLKWMTFPHLSKPLLCDMSTATARPYVPDGMRRSVFASLHGLAHPGIRGSRQLIASRFFWPEMNKDVGQWAKTCIACQRSKVQRHTVSPPGQFVPAARFEHVHLDIIGPLPSSSGMRYCLTMVDRFTRWPEAQPIPDISSATCAEALCSTWIARFGVPSRITTDQGRQFESDLFGHLSKTLGFQRCRTSAYHPQSNGCVERWHRTLKAALTAQLHSDVWTSLLPLVLLGLRAAVRSDNVTSAAEMVYGQPLRIPGELLETSRHPESTEGFVRQLRQHMQSLRPAPHRQSTGKTFIHRDLATCTHVFLRDDTVHRPLIPPYNGPFKVLARGEKTFKIQSPSGPKTVSVDRLKPAFLLPEEDSDSGIQQTPPRPPANDPCVSTNDPAEEQPVRAKTSRAGRCIRLPVRFLDEVIGGSDVAEARF